LPAADLLVRPKRGAGLVTLGIYAPGLREAERPESAGLTTLLLRGALRGAGGLAAPELAFAAESLGGTVGAVAGTDVAGWAITVPVSSARQAAFLLRAIALEAALDEDELRRERVLQADDAARARDDMFRYPLQRALRQAFGADPYGQPQLGEPDTVAHLPGDAVRGLAHRLRGCRAAAVAVGDLGARELLDCLVPLMDWPSTGGPPSASRALGSPSWTPGCDGERREKAQTALALAFPARTAASPDRCTLEVIGALLSGLAGRLFDALRERRSLAYTVSALPWLRRRAGAVLAYVATAPERESEARAGVLDQLERLAREPVSAEELEGARRYAAGLAEIGRQHAAAVASEMLDAWVSGTLADWYDLPQRLRAVRAEDVARVAATVFRRDLMAEYVVRGG
jgi:zinc protease